MLSKSAQYALRAVICLAVNSDEEHKHSPKDIADKIEIPVAYLASILKQLSKRGIISSSKGRNGGFYLTKENAQTPLIEIVECIDGLQKITSCVMGIPKCSHENPCPLHHLYLPLRNDILDELSNKTIKEFAKGVIDGDTVLIDQTTS